MYVYVYLEYKALLNLYVRTYVDDDMEDNGMNLNKPKRPCDCRNVTKLVSPTRTICPSIPTATQVTPSPSPITPSVMVTATPSNGDTSDILTASKYFYLMDTLYETDTYLHCVTSNVLQV